jgi:hypothetical protein
MTPTHLLPCELDTRDPNFPAKCMAMTDQMRFEMGELVALARKNIDESRGLMAQVDRQLAAK